MPVQVDLTKVFKEIGKVKEQIAMLPKPANTKPIYETYNINDKPYLKHQIDFRDIFNRVINNWLT